MPRISDTRYLVTATWEDAPHLTKEDKKKIFESIPVYQRKARSKGIPSLGVGAIFPIDEDRLKCEPFEIPEYWPCAYALDVGWNCTATLWGAWDRQSDIVYIWSEYKQGQAEPATHVDAIKARGNWIPGVIDPASCGSNQKDGTNLYDEYCDMGLLLDLANNSVEAGIHTVYRRMVSGRLKVFSTLVGFWDEFRVYQRGKDGKISKKNDHLMDCLRYLVFSGMTLALDRDQALDPEDIRHEYLVGSNEVTGY